MSALDVSEAEWAYCCPKCGNAGSRMLYLGRRVTCKCGGTFVFPWWNMIPATVKGMPPVSLTVK